LLIFVNSHTQVLGAKYKTTGIIVKRSLGDRENPLELH